jgi:trk system potassium uptake protein TrkH
VLIKPTAADFGVIAYYVGRLSLVMGFAGLAPLLWAAVAGEWHPFASLLIMIGLFAVVGVVGVGLAPSPPRLEWSHGMAVVALTWLIAPVIGAVPLYMSGHFGTPLDALFDSVSGLTTTGLSVMSDLDHLATSINFWRHLMQYMGGLGIIVAALTVFAGPGGITLYVGEGRGERFLPSVTSTARFIWAVATVHLVVLVAALSVVGWALLGFDAPRAFFHATTMFLAGFSTGGFAPQSTSIGYYHSGVFEAVAAISMLAGAMSFGLHHILWRGPRRDALRNLETRTILTTFALTVLLTLFGLAASATFTNLTGLTRQGFLQVFSAHTTTGWATVTSAELSDWGGLAFGGMAIAMALGGMGSSTAGGVKALRVGLTFTTIIKQIKRALLPERALVAKSYYQSGVRRLTDDVAISVMTISLLYVALFLLGAGVGIAYGIPLRSAMFESVSAAATIGLSVGVTDPSMPVLLQVVYMLEMWAGRLEFFALFSLLGLIYASIRGK